MARNERPTSRAALLEFAILGLLHDGALHGYELRKRLTTALGIFPALSYGSLYPALRGSSKPVTSPRPPRRPCRAGGRGSRTS